MPVLVDADWAMDAVAGRTEAKTVLERLIATEGVAISWVTVGELYDGAFGSADPQAELAVHRGFLQSFLILGLNGPIMERFAAIRADLRRRGQTIPDLDIIAAATALHYDLTVLTRDDHFHRVPGLRLYNEGGAQKAA